MSRRFIHRVLFVVVAVFGLLLVTDRVSAQGRSGEERVRDVQKRHMARLIAIKGVVGTGIGYDQADQPDLKVFVENEGVAGLPKKLDDVSVEVVVTGKIYALKPGKPSGSVDPRARFLRPVPIGVSTGHPAITAGTIGCRVKDAFGNVYALSNNHVYANQNDAFIFDTVLQPGVLDGGIDPDDSIGTLSAFIPIDFSAEGENTVDAAIALSSTALLGNATPSNGYGTPKSIPLPASINMQVQKYGRTTGLTKGRIYAVDFWGYVQYSSGREAMFVNQLMISPSNTTGTFSDGGDSGSLIVTTKSRLVEANRPVGLLFAGTAPGRDSYTIANPIDAVLSAFSGSNIVGDSVTITIDGE